MLRRKSQYKHPQLDQQRIIKKTGVSHAMRISKKTK